MLLGMEHDHSYKLLFTVWLGRVLLPGRLRGVELPSINELQEVETMLAERVKEWTREWWDGGMRQGIEQGIEQGMQRGEAAVLLRLLERKYGANTAAAYRDRIVTETLLEWSDRILVAEKIEEIFR